MIREAIGSLLRNLPVFLFVAALLSATFLRDGKPIAERFLAWILLLPIGAAGLWAATSHLFVPAVAAAHIGRQTSPFQFEVGMADLAIGVTACIAFWRDLSFKTGAAFAASIFLLGNAIGHVRQMVEAGDFAPGERRASVYMDIICPVLAIALVAFAKGQQGRLVHDSNVVPQSG